MMYPSAFKLPQDPDIVKGLKIKRLFIYTCEWDLCGGQCMLLSGTSWAFQLCHCLKITHLSGGVSK